MIKKFFKDITGITAKEEKKVLEEKVRFEHAEKIRIRKEESAEKRRLAKEEKAIAKYSSKEIATKKKEAWVDVIGFKVNPNDIRNGFYELDWNDYFIIELKKEEYGFDGDPEEEIVDRWFRDLAGNMLAEAGQDPSRATAGYINVSKLPNGRAQVE